MRPRLMTTAVISTALAVAVAAAAPSPVGAVQPSRLQPTTALTVDTAFVIKGLDPHSVYEGTGIMTVHALYDTLMTFRGDDFKTPVPDLAEKYEASADSKTFTFTLKDGLKFSDGSPLTSADVLFSLNRLKNLAAGPSSLVTDLTFAAPDDKTVVVTSAVADPNVPTIMAMDFTGVVNSTLAKSKGATDAADAATADTAAQAFNQQSMGSGPYVLESFDPASAVVLTANPNHVGDAPVFQRVVIQNMDVQTQRITMEKQPAATVALDLAGNALDGLPAELTISGTVDTYYELRFHSDPAVSEVAANPNFVKAFRASMDFQGIAALFGKEAQPAAGIVPTAFAGALPASEAQHQDLEAAKKFLAESGLTNPKISLLYPALTYRGVDLGTIAAKVQADAKMAGIEVELEPAPIASFLDKRRGGQVPLSFSPQSLDLPIATGIPPDMMPGGATAERIGFTTADPALVAAAAKVADTPDIEGKLAALQDWQRALIANSPYITLCYSSGTVVASADLTGAIYAPAGWLVDLAAIGVK